jgi:hypothetical protein
VEALGEEDRRRLQNNVGSCNEKASACQETQWTIMAAKDARLQGVDEKRDVSERGHALCVRGARHEDDSSCKTPLSACRMMSYCGGD